MKRKRSTKDKVRQRVEQVLQMRLAGAQFADLRTFARENKWRLSDGQLRRYLRKTDALLAQTLEKDREKLINLQLAKLGALYARTVDTGDYRTARVLLKDEREVLGLCPPRKTDHDDDSKRPLTDEERLAEIAALLDRARQKAAG
jgi:hypothetical protein